MWWRAAEFSIVCAASFSCLMMGSSPAAPAGPAGMGHRRFKEQRDTETTSADDRDDNVAETQYGNASDNGTPKMCLTPEELLPRRKVLGGARSSDQQGIG